MIPLDLIKSSLRLELESTIDDAYLTHLESAALAEFEQSHKRTLYAQGATLPDPVGNALTINANIIQGALMLIAHWYNHREVVVLGVTAVELPMATTLCWAKYKFFSL